jgi:prevent-host-death family protein
MTMKTCSVSHLKAHLSEELRHVQAGEELVVTDRDRPVARLVPYVNPARRGALDRLAAAGLAKRGPGVDESFWSLRRPADPENRLGAVVRREREEGW